MIELSAKTFIISMVIILALSLGFVGYIYKTVNPSDNLSNLINKYIPVSKKPASIQLTLNSPDDNQLVFDNTLLVSGSTNPGASVVISDQSFDHLLKANDQGNFSDTVALDSGVNIFTVTVFSDNGDTKSNIKQVYYSKTKI